MAKTAYNRTCIWCGLPFSEHRPQADPKDPRRDMPCGGTQRGFRTAALSTGKIVTEKVER